MVTALVTVNGTRKRSWIVELVPDLPSPLPFQMRKRSSLDDSEVGRRPFSNPCLMSMIKKGIKAWLDRVYVFDRLLEG